MGGRHPAFRARVLQAVRTIPAGRLSTYGDVAAMAGVPRAARAVGNIMRGCRDPAVPCHRVVGAGGRLGGYGAPGPALKRTLLRAEGVIVVGRRIRRFTQLRWIGRRHDELAEACARSLSRGRELPPGRGNDR
jgi:O-6-methylguanine DNA methyltransferase